MTTQQNPAQILAEAIAPDIIADTPEDILVAILIEAWLPQLTRIARQRVKAITGNGHDLSQCLAAYQDLRRARFYLD